MSFSQEKRTKMMMRVHFLLTHGKKVAEICKILKISKQTAYKYEKELTQKKLLEKTGTGYASPKTMHKLTIDVGGADEIEIWEEWVSEFFAAQAKNVKKILYYAFAEMFNNVISHSGSQTAEIEISEDFSSFGVKISDFGVGAFRKIQEEKGLKYLRQALLELVKGKCTTAPSEHSGEGIFFTSKLVDTFSLFANGLNYKVNSFAENDFLTEEAVRVNPGTIVFMEIEKATEREPAEIFAHYTEENDLTFSKTVVPVIYLINRKNNDTMTLVSRSQAKRLLEGADKFKAVVLDFAGISEIGQGFADEAFRVYQNLHPTVRIDYINANENIERMIRHVIGNKK